MPDHRVPRVPRVPRPTRFERIIDMRICYKIFGVWLGTAHLVYEARARAVLGADTGSEGWSSGVAEMRRTAMK